MPATYQDRIDGIATSVAIKAPVIVATTANITLSGLQTVDMVALSSEDRVLVKDQTNQAENGIWDAQSTAWTRAKDFNGRRDAVKGTLVPVPGGAMYELTTADPVTIGTDSLVFAVSALAPVIYPITIVNGGTGEITAAAAMTALGGLTTAQVLAKVLVFG